MNDLFNGKGSEGYSAKDIEVLEGLEPVRRRPGMYIGGTDENALHHLAAELLDNAMDEAVAGHASFIEVTLEPGNWVTVRLVAQATVAGTETTEFADFLLPVLAADVTVATVTPPGGVLGPFGTDSSCTDPN